MRVCKGLEGGWLSFFLSAPLSYSSALLPASLLFHPAPQIDYVTCSKVVGDIMAADTMQSVKHLFPDILERISVLLYQVW